MMSLLKPRVLSVLNMKEWLRLSNAFLKSIRSISPASFLEIVELIRFIMLIMTDPMLFSAVYAFCSFPMIWVTAGLSLFVMHALASL